MREVRELHVTGKETTYHNFRTALEDITIWCTKQHNEAFDKFQFRHSYANDIGVCVLCSKEVNVNDSDFQPKP